MKSNNDFDAILDQATAEMRNEQIDPTVVNKAAERVWARIAVEAPVQTTEAVSAERIENCADFQSLIPAYLSGNLSEARSLLLVDHTHECIPCRKAMKDARSRRMAPAKKAAVTRRYSISPVVLRWGIAAVLVIGLGLVAVPLFQRLAPFGGNLEATVQAAEGQVYQIADTRSTPVKVGDKLQKGDRLRTAKDAHAFIRLGDGSVVEVKDRSEFYITKNLQGTTIHLDRGAILVEAAKQGKQALFVDTGDSRVSVTGTIFSVNSGTKGSRVSVIEGEVHLDHANNERVLRAGEQATTSASIEKVAVKDEVAWSRNSARYAQTLAAFASLNKELGKVSLPGVRNSTHLLDLMPENTIVYAALPNLTSTIVESHRIMQDRINQNSVLRQWYEKKNSNERGHNVDQVMGTIREFGDYLGEEIAVSVSMDEKGDPVAPLVLAELKNSAGLQQSLEQQVAKYAGNQQGRPEIRFVADPNTATPAAVVSGKKVDELFVWIENDLFAASPKLQQLQAVTSVVRGGGQSGFTSTAFHNRIAQVYQEGAGLVVAANLERLIEKAKPELLKSAVSKDAKTSAEQSESALKQLGILNLKYFVLDQKKANGKTQTQATVSFSESQRGIPSWLAAPAPMGSLEYISPDANVVAGFVVKDPVRLVDDLLGVIETVSPDLRKNLDKQMAERGVDIRKDIAAPLGGEFAFAIDGPILPTPAWKMVFEVNDSQHLQETLERIVGEVNKEAAKFGKSGLVWDRAEIGGRPYYTLKSSDFGLLEVNYTYVNGYVVMGPSRAMVERSVRAQDQGYTLLRSSRFTAGLPADGNANFSAIFYHNLAPLVQPFAESIASRAQNLPQEQQQAIKAMAADMPPTLAYAYAQGDSITFKANTEGGPFGLSPATIMGVPNALEIQSVLQRGMKK
ncbi:MAG TPA: FecR domain-containing protein [Pyrinomonadaceae bacterium]|nr:FecR domain-containing protein [Pyrinomonadaceae bacterium]